METLLSLAALAVTLVTPCYTPMQDECTRAGLAVNFQGATYYEDRIIYWQNNR